MNKQTKRLYGCVILKSINSNFNADFTHQPRTLPDGTIYATDKALKYAVKDYLRKNYSGESLFYIKRADQGLNPLTLDTTYTQLFPEALNADDATKRLQVLKNLLSCLDIRLFGGTFASKKVTNLSLHGPVQINHGVNRYPDNTIYSEDILSPFATESKKDKDGKKDEESKAKQSTIGNQSNVKEVHYVYHVSVNPKNLEELAQRAGSDGLTIEDIEKLKESLKQSVTALDSSRKINTENEALIWVTMKEGSKKHLPSFSELVFVKKDRTDDGKVIIDCSKVKEIIDKSSEDIEAVEVFFNATLTHIDGLPIGGSITHHELS
jgi:CRISPR-associated protein Csh2